MSESITAVRRCGHPQLLSVPPAVRLSGGGATAVSVPVLPRCGVVCSLRQEPRWRFGLVWVVILSRRGRMGARLLWIGFAGEEGTGAGRFRLHHWFTDRWHCQLQAFVKGARRGDDQSGSVCCLRPRRRC
jgi:hypothetical protein